MRKCDLRGTAAADVHLPIALVADLTLSISFIIVDIIIDNNIIINIDRNLCQLAP